MADTNFITFIDITKIFDKNVVLDNLTLDIPEGEIFGVIGKSGSGKTTLLSILVGFLKPEKGKVFFKGQEVTDNYNEVLQEFGFTATVFVPTGLLENPDYMSWSNLSSLSGSFHFGNHTWSHKNMQTAKDKVEFEIGTADTQLSERGLNNPKVFAFTYGLVGDYAKKYLEELEYKLAFGTRPGSTLCKKQRFELPRVRVGDTKLSNYGF